MNASFCRGSVFYTPAESISILDSHFFANSALEYGGVIQSSFAEGSTFPLIIRLLNSTFFENHARKRGSVLYLISRKSDVIIEGCSIANNTDGCGVWDFASTPKNFTLESDPVFALERDITISLQLRDAFGSPVCFPTDKDKDEDLVVFLQVIERVFSTQFDYHGKVHFDIPWKTFPKVPKQQNFAIAKWLNILSVFNVENAENCGPYQMLVHTSSTCRLTFQVSPCNTVICKIPGEGRIINPQI